MGFAFDFDLSLGQDDLVKSGLATEQRVPRELRAQLGHFKNNRTVRVAKDQILHRHHRVDTNPVSVQAGDLDRRTQRLSQLVQKQGPNGIEPGPKQMAHPNIPAAEENGRKHETHQQDPGPACNGGITRKCSFGRHLRRGWRPKVA